MGTRNKYIWLLTGAIKSINNGEFDCLQQLSQYENFLQNPELSCARYYVTLRDSVCTRNNTERAAEEVLEAVLAVIDEDRTEWEWVREGDIEKDDSSKMALVKTKCYDEKLYYFIENVLLRNVSLDIDFRDIGLSLDLVEKLVMNIEYFEKNKSSYQKVSNMLEDQIKGFDFFSMWVIKSISFTFDEEYDSKSEEYHKYKEVALINTIILMLAYRAQKLLLPPEMCETLKLTNTGDMPYSKKKIKS